MSRTLFEEFDSMFEDFDNIDSILLLSNDINFENFDFLNIDTSQFQVLSDIESFTMKRDSNNHWNEWKHNAKKRFKTIMNSLIEVLIKKWKKNKEEWEKHQLIDDERVAKCEKKKNEHDECVECDQNEMIAVLKQIVETISYIIDFTIWIIDNFKFINLII